MSSIVVQNSVMELRQARGVTQEELAIALEVSRQTVSALEKGNYAPSVLLALKISEYFGVAVNKVFFLKKV